MPKAVYTKQPESFISPYSRYGLLRSSTPDRRVWLYARTPWSTALLDGADDNRRQNAAYQFGAFFDGLARLVNASALKYRYMLSSSYREFHILASAMPVPFQVAPSQRSTPLGRWQTANYSNLKVQKQFAVIGVPLNTGNRGRKGHRKTTFLQRTMHQLDSLAYSIANSMADFDDFLADAETIEGIMETAGLEPFTKMDPTDRANLIAEMKSWWVSRAHASSLPILCENDHMHLFPNGEICQVAKKLYDDDIDCKDWDLPGEYPASVCFARSSTFAKNRIVDPSNLWIAKLLEVNTAGGANAVGVSIRGKVEPGVVTADQIRRNSQTINESVQERWKKGREAPGDMQDIKERLDWKKSIYRHQNMPPTLYDLSVAVLAAGTAQQALDSLAAVPELEFVNLNTSSEQLIGFKSMQVCSPFRMTPYELQWSDNCVAGAGISSFAKAGDSSGALLGLSEANRQPVYISTTAVQDENKVPFFVIVGKPGSGKSMALVSLMIQFAKIMDRNDRSKQTAVILINPKEGNDFEDEVIQQGGQVIRLDSDLSNGQLDVFNILPDKEEAKRMAAIMLSNILHPEGDDSGMEIAVTSMLSYGVKRGATCCGVALDEAYKAYMQEPDHAGLPENTPKVWEAIHRIVRDNQDMRLIFGTTPNVRPLRVSQGITLINAGERSLIPTADSEHTFTGRIQQWVLRLTVLGAGAAVRGRDGMVGLDEAWVAVDGGKGTGETLKHWERMARSQRFTPILASQKVQEFIDAGLAGGISRGLILSLDNPDESNGTVSQAKAALRLLSIDDRDGQILSRMPLDPQKDNGKPNYRSLQALTVDDPDHPGKRKVVRGSIGYFKDGSNLPIPVEITIAPDMLPRISTSALDKIQRQQQQDQEVAA